MRCSVFTVNPCLPVFLENYHHVYNTPKHMNLTLKVQTDDPQKVGKLNFTFTDESSVRLGDEELTLGELRLRVQQNVINDVMNHESTGTFSTGAYHYDRTKQFIFDPN